MNMTEEEKNKLLFDIKNALEEINTSLKQISFNTGV